MSNDENPATTSAETQDDFGLEGLLEGLHEDLQERGESARATVAVWNKRVELWRLRHGDKPIPAKAFKDHPAADMIAGMLEQSGLFTDEGAVDAGSALLVCSNKELRQVKADALQSAAQLFDVAHLAADPALNYAKARMFCHGARVAGRLLEWRTITSEEICDLPVENISICILARTADVREGGDNE